MFNASLSAGYFPQKFKEAILKFIPKETLDQRRVQNYRPISLLEIMGKMFERVLDNRIRFYLNRNRLNNPDQHCGRSGRGTNTALAVLYTEIAESQRFKDQCNVVLRDISKAFNKVWHQGLKFKLCHLNMPSIFTATLCNFLDGRSARIQIKDYIGPPFNLSSGVPQGSCLSPTLFSIYMADMPQSGRDFRIVYADDISSVITYGGGSKQMLKLKTQRAISEINDFEQK